MYREIQTRRTGCVEVEMREQEREEKKKRFRKVEVKGENE